MPRALMVGGVLLLVVLAWFAQGPLRSVFWQLMTPVVAVRNALGASEAQQLREQVAALTARLADRDALYQENLDLKAVLNRAAGRSVTVVGILQRPPVTPYDTFIIDAGRDHGVVVGSFVSLGGSALVGTVREVYATAAHVALYSAPGTTHDGILVVAGRDVPVSIEGQGGGSMRAEVPAGTGARVGDAVVLPGVGMGLMATVSHVEARSGESFETVYFALPADLNARFVEIWQ